jgi:glycosyltransferase involved in cell wall biosynthesis
MAKLIPPGTRVLEFGAGRMVLRDYLPEGCRYTPSDLVDRGIGTIVCDLNARDLPAFPPHDVAVFSGVLTYVNEVEELIRRISSSFKLIVVAYPVFEQSSSKVARRAHGWVNDHTSVEFEGIFLRSGYRCDHVGNWRAEKVYRFVREQADGGYAAEPEGSPAVRCATDENSAARRGGGRSERSTMHIAFVVKDMYYGGGAYYDSLSRRLANRGNRVWLISSVQKDADDFRKDGVQFLHAPMWRSAIPFTSLLRWEWRVARLLRDIRDQHGLDLVEFPSYRPEGLVYALKRRRAKVVIRVHEGRRPITLKWLWSDTRDAAREALCWIQMTCADVILPNSAMVHDACLRFLGSPRNARKILTVHPGMDLDFYAPNPVPPAAYQSLDGKPIILFVGRITEAKGTYNLIEAFRDQISQRFRDAVLVLVGVPEDPDRLRRTVQDASGKVIHLDNVPTKDLPAYYSHAYVFVGPSRSEPFGAVFVEALGCGLPVIAVAKGGPLEIVQPEETGLLCPDNSPSSIAQAVERLLADRDLRDHMARQARASVVRRFSIDEVTSRLLETYQATLEGRDCSGVEPQKSLGSRSGFPA